MLGGDSGGSVWIKSAHKEIGLVSAEIMPSNSRYALLFMSCWACISTLGVMQAGAADSSVDRSDVCEGFFSRADNRPSRINWTVSCSEGEGPMTIWIYPARRSHGSEWPIAFSHVVSANGSGASGPGSCISGGLLRPLACHTHRSGPATFKGWITVNRSSRCERKLVLSRSIAKGSERPSVLLPRSEELFRGVPRDCKNASAARAPVAHPSGA